MMIWTGDYESYVAAVEDIGGMGRPAPGFWISSRSGHAAWAASDGRLFVFGGVGLHPIIGKEAIDYSTEGISHPNGRSACAMLGSCQNAKTEQEKVVLGLFGVYSG